MTFDEALAAKISIESANVDACRDLRNVPGVGTGPMGLTPDNVRATAAYQSAKRANDKTFARLRSFNAWFVTKFKTEYRAHINAKRKA